MANKSKSWDYLPEVMITEVLSRLPVKSLLICKAVCKSWLFTITSPYFIKSQLHYSVTCSQNHPTLLDIINPYYTPNCFLLKKQRPLQLFNDALADTTAQDLSTSAIHFVRVSLPDFKDPFIDIISCCNGIVCLCLFYDAHVYLWNPSINQFKKLTFPTLYKFIRHKPMIRTLVVFGYDYIADDYKLFKIMYQPKIVDFVPRVQLYSANADCFKKFKAPVIKNKELMSNMPNGVKPNYVVVNGVLYFDSEDELVSFDLHEEVFGLVPYPSCIEKKRSDVLDFEGSLAMVIQSGPGVVDLWTLDDVSEKVSWTKKFSFGCDLDDLDTEIWLSTYVGAGQFYGFRLWDEYYILHEVLYDNEKKDIKTYGLREYVNDASGRFTKSKYATHKHIETLVSLHGFKPVKMPGRHILKDNIP